MAALVRHSVTPGDRGTAPASWTGGDLARPTLIVAAHPRCPCTRATLHELESILQAAGPRVSCVVLFTVPAAAGDGWMRSDVWKQAALPVKVRADIDGREAGSLGARTSGHTFLFAADGRLLFSGGITASRGHVGPSTGRGAVLAQLDREGAAMETPVFGCPLTPMWR